MALEPETREEIYLSAAAGQNITMPKPVTRKEMLLQAVVDNIKSGGATPDVIENAVNNYLDANPVKPGATAEQADQIEQNKNDIADLQTEVDELKESGGNGSGGNANQGGLSTTAVDLLMDILAAVQYHTNVSGKIKQLREALLSGGETVVVLSSISAVYSGGDVEVGTAVSTLTGIVVTAHYSNGTTAPVTDYTLSGEIAEGNNVITVSYGGMTTTFTVMGVSEETEVTLSGISATYSGGEVTEGTALTDLTGIVVTATYSDGSASAVTGYTLSGVIAVGENTITVSYGGKTTTITVTGVSATVPDDITVSDGVMTIVTVGSAITVSNGVMTIA